MAGWVDLPIHRSGPNWLGQKIHEAREYQRQRSQDRAATVKAQFDRERLEENDFQNAYLTATKLVQAGDGKAAEAIMGKYGFTLEQAVQKAEEMGLGAGNAPPAVAPTQPAASFKPEAVTGDERDAGTDYAQMEAARPDINPIVDAAAATQRRKQEQSQQRAMVLRGRFRGREYAIDPGAAMEERARRLDAVVAQSDDPMVQQLYPKMRPWLLSSTEGMDPKDVFGMFQQASREKAADAAKEEAVRLEAEKNEREKKERKEQFDYEEGVRQTNREKTARIYANRPVRPGEAIDNTRADVSAFNVNYDRWEKQANVDKLTDGYDKFQEMQKASDAYRQTGDVINQRNTLYQAARYITGPGVLTQSEYENTSQGSAGLIASFMTKMSRAATGEISAAEQAAMEKFIRNANAAIRSKAMRAVANYDQKFGAASYYGRTVPEEVAAARDALVSRFGLSPEETAPPAPRPAARGPKKQSSGGQAVIDMREDSAAIKWAKENPGDPRAVEILRLNGKQ